MKAIRKLIMLWDNVWAMDRIWLVVKWPFGVLVLWFVLFVIWNKSIDSRFDEKFLAAGETRAKDAWREVKSIAGNLHTSPAESVKDVR